MRRHLDIAVLAAVAVLCGSAGLLAGDVPTAATVVLALPLVLFLPGYAALEALHPAPLGTARRLTLALSLSIAADVVLALLLDRSSFGLTAHTWAAALVATTLAGCLAAGLRRRRGASRSREPAWFHLGLVDVAALAVAALLVAVAVALARTPLSATRAQGYAMLWMVPGASAGTVRVGVQSGRLRPTTYRLVVRAGGKVVYRQARLRLDPGERTVRSIRIGGDIDAQAPVTAWLYRAGDPDIYRRAQLVTRDGAGR